MTTWKIVCTEAMLTPLISGLCLYGSVTGLSRRGERSGVWYEIQFDPVVVGKDVPKIKSWIKKLLDLDPTPRIHKSGIVAQ